jgi:hypothetical protein
MLGLTAPHSNLSKIIEENNMASANDAWESKPHRYLLTFQTTLSSYDKGHSQIYQTRIGLDEPITPEIEEAELLKMKGRQHDQKFMMMHLVAWSKYA